MCTLYACVSIKQHKAVRGYSISKFITWLILGLSSANERRRYELTSSFIGWAQTLNQPCNSISGAFQSIAGYFLVSMASISHTNH